MDIQTLLIDAVALIVGIVIHESAHALAAYVLGDKTARSRGRVSLNPLAHIDPFGTVLLPLLMLAAGGPVFAFAKPVPVYLNNLKHPKRDELLVALAGPLSNVLLALAGALIGYVLLPLLAGQAAMSLLYSLFSFFMTFIVVNLSLAFFNLIPLPPLDGSSILVPFLKGKALREYYRIQQYAMPILLVILYLLPTVLHIDIIGMYFDITVYPLAQGLTSFMVSAI
ncbi:site-2 protease family protein [Collinsella bouchesdurhonensis]|uniref:site-2 protease family protein n=1 Tax=Collinsella bouchesdurhonensis TaxID=1907654 RepID=UPI001484DE08|nr:site-2 protease family protein [Collinsella bouchesdurhonensis]